jgi:tight adherence protein B
MRRETLREVRTLMAGAVFTSYIVPLLGVGALVLLNTINSNTLPRMTSSPIGITALVLAAVLFTLGSLAIRRVTRIEV